MFEAGARNNWHSHPGGQLLFCTDGIGFYQEKGKPARRLVKGDIVEILPGIVHWHGAAPDSNFTHLGVSPNIDMGNAEWFNAVTDEEYSKVTGQ
jgi:quercetin dioxygenase-like cupin family protein